MCTIVLLYAVLFFVLFLDLGASGGGLFPALKSGLFLSGRKCKDQFTLRAHVWVGRVQRGGAYVL